MAQQTQGSAYSTLYRGQRQKFSWKVTSTDPVKRTSTIKWTLGTWSDNTTGPTYFVCQKTQSLSLYYNGTTWRQVVSLGQTYTDGGATVWNGFCDPGSWLDKNYRNKKYWDTNGDYTGIQRWVKILGPEWKSGTFTLNHDANGNARFGVQGMFHWFDSGDRPLSVTWFDVSSIGKAKYEVSFESAIQASNIPNSVVKEHGTPLTLSTLIPVTAGHTFRGWKDLDTGIVYQAGQTFNEDKNTVLQAVWDINKYSIKVDLDGGLYNGSSEISSLQTVPADAAEYVGNSTFNIPWNTEVRIPTGVVKTGYSLQGWLLDNNALTGVYKVQSDAVLKPNWVANVYQVTLVDSATNKIIRNVSVTYDEYVEGLFGYNKPGYELLGWSQDSYAPYTMEETIPDENFYIRFRSSVDSSSDTKKYSASDLGNKRHSIPNNCRLYTLLRYKTSTYIYSGGEWKLVLPYVRQNGVWKLAMPEIKHNGEWKL